MAKRKCSPAQLCLAWFRKRDMPCAVVEKWIKIGIRRDVFGGDIQALTATEIIGVQAGASSMHAAKVKHAIAHPEVRQWLQAPTRLFWVMTWQKRPHFLPSGKRAKVDRWTPRCSSINLVDGRLVEAPLMLSPEVAPRDGEGLSGRPRTP
jgi:hypothetical protein